MYRIFTRCLQGLDRPQPIKETERIAQLVAREPVSGDRLFVFASKWEWDSLKH